MSVTLIAALLSVQPAPVPAEMPAEIQYRSHDVAAALKRGCKVQRVHIAGGRAEHAAIVRCPARALARR